MLLGNSPLFTHLKNLFLNEEGQDLVEYALVVALIALAATAGMQTLASDISAAFTGVGTTLNTDM
jgi:pilus assembly protein Flp/PilA